MSKNLNIPKPNLAPKVFVIIGPVARCVSRLASVTVKREAFGKDVCANLRHNFAFGHSDRETNHRDLVTVICFVVFHALKIAEQNAETSFFFDKMRTSFMPSRE